MDPLLAEQPPRKKQKRVSFAQPPGPDIPSRAEASRSATGEPFEVAYMVDVTIPSTGEVVVENMDNLALQRFTMVGQQQLPRRPTFTDRVLNHRIGLLEEGSCAPSKAATLAVLQWMQQRQHFNEPGCIKGNDLGRDDLEFLLNAYAACSALRTTFSLLDLVNYIKRTINWKGVSMADFAAMFELLPQNHLIIQHAVKWLVNMHLAADIDPESGDPTAEYLNSLPELRELFEFEKATEKARLCLLP